MPDHPRACGENVAAWLVPAMSVGSPPRLRGKLMEEIGNKTQGRITPALAGKTDMSINNVLPPEDHPRACGENKNSKAFTVLYIGSPPRLRGKPKRENRVSRDIRITPALAGKTRVAVSHYIIHLDHPRACGENSFTLPLPIGVSGSPPRLRGKHMSDIFQ